jgi:hypothetical protein
MLKAASGSLEPKTPDRRTTSTGIIDPRQDARLDATRQPAALRLASRRRCDCKAWRTASDPTGFAVLTPSQASNAHRSMLPVAPLP